MPAVPGFEPPIEAICVAPFGMEEGSDATLPGQTFALYVGEPVQFRFFASAVRREDAVGAVLEEWSDDELAELDPIETLLTAAEGAPEGEVVHVQLTSSVTTTGTLAIHCAAADGRRWKLEFNVRNP